MKKVSKSLQAVLVTLIVGMLISNAFSLTGNIFIDKIAWKIILSALFALSTFSVSVLYALNFIKGRVAGGKTRIIIYILLVVIICTVAMPIVVAFAQTLQCLFYLIGILSIIGILLLILYAINEIAKTRKLFKVTQETSVKKINTPQKIDIIPTQNIVHQFNISNKQFNVENQTENNSTLYKLWEDHDFNKKCLTVTNDENPDLEWVKIYKPPYGNGKFYGYVKMINAYKTVNGEIFYANHSIWREID